MYLGFWIESLMKLSEMKEEYKDLLASPQTIEPDCYDMGGEPWVYVQVR